jgi:uncharacterized protein DUF4410
MTTCTTIRILIATVALNALACGVATAQETRNTAPKSAPKVSVVYVTDFELAAENVKPASGVLPGPVGQILRGGPSALKSPADRAHDLVELMAKTLTNQLINEGINARRLSATAPRPAEGWIVRGVFTRVEQGNRFQRAMIGLGAGQTDLTVVVTVEDPMKGTPVPMDDIVSGAHSSKLLGAAPMAVIRFNPATVAAKFVMSGHDLERNVVQTAVKVASEVAAGARR